MVKKIKIFTLTILFAVSCAPQNTITLSPAALVNDTGTTTAPLDTLAAYRKMPGSPKSNYVKGFYRKTNHGRDSVYVAGYYRSERQ